MKGIGDVSTWIKCLLDLSYYPDVEENRFSYMYYYYPFTSTGISWLLSLASRPDVENCGNSTSSQPDLLSGELQRPRLLEHRFNTKNISAHIYYLIHV